VALLCIEIVLSFKSFSKEAETWRVSGAYQLDNELIYSLKPLHDTTTSSSGMTERIKTNSMGLGDSEIKDASLYKKRIIVLGDSMTFGHGVSSQDAYPNQLERLFQEKGRQVDVVNAGIKGYGTDQSYKLFVTRLRPLKPDLVIFAIFMNDIYDNIILPLYTINDDTLVPISPKKNWLYVLGKIHNFLPKIIRERKITRFILSRFEEKDLFSVLPRIDEKELLIWSIKKAYYQIDHLQKLGETDGFKLLVVCMPHKGNISEAYSWLEKDGIWLYNSHKNNVWAQQEEALFFANDYHLTKKGNALLAKQLYDVIQQKGF
jgi:lysophospholipase L1-like esterase